jgi:hypothetical protein
MWILSAALGLALNPSPSPAPSLPFVSRCELGKTQRVGFAVDNAPPEAIYSLVRIGLYGKKGEWIADEIVLAGIDAPIFPIAGLLDPHAVASVTCSFEGYATTTDQQGIVGANDSPRGRKRCSQRDGLDVDGGPDAQVGTIAYGADWIMLRLGLYINHFFPNQESAFNGDVFAISIDAGPPQNVVVTGPDGQTLSLLFTNLKPGLHQIDYAPWVAFDAVSKGSPGFSGGYHNVCIKI